MLELNLRQFTEVVESDPKLAKRLQRASSPGPVAARLGITRQGVHKLLTTGTLEGARLLTMDGNLAAILIFQDSLDAYERTRRLRAAS